MSLLLVAIVVVLQLVDAWSTWQAYRFKVGYESNPVTAKLMDRFGLYWGLFVAKAWGIALVVGVQLWTGWNSQAGMTVLCLLIGYFGATVFKNLRILYSR